MTTAFQPDAFQSDAFQIDGGTTLTAEQQTAFQQDAFQSDAFQIFGGVVSGGGHALSGAHGTYVIAGKDGSLHVTRALSGSAGAYVINGQDATLTYAPGTAVNYALAGACGAYVIGGQPGQFSYQSSSGANTPGRVVRQDWWKSKESPSNALTLTSAKSGRLLKEYSDESSRVGTEISKLRAESARLRIEIVGLEAEINADGVRRLNEQAALEQKLLFARQAALLVAVQEAVLREEMEVIDVAYIAAVFAVQTQ